MKIIRKNVNLIEDNRGETIVEVVVAFAVLSIMLVMFAQGISYASNTSVRASKTREKSDIAMQELQKDMVNRTADMIPVAGEILVYRQVREIELDDGTKYYYVVYVSNT